MQKRAFNFSPGPSVLPTPVLEEAQAKLLDYDGRGMSIMEMSHRSPAFLEVAQSAERDLKTLLNIPDNYHTLFLQGGARLQFSMVPMNLLPPGKNKNQVAYVDTGHWSLGAIKEAQRLAEVSVVASSADKNYQYIPSQTTWKIPKNPAYLHYTPNETLHGLEFHWVPETGSVPLVADMSSTILSRPIDVSQFGIIYAGAQKNIGPSGLTLVIIRDDLLSIAPSSIPSMMTYDVYAKNQSMYNTPPTFAIYLASLTFQWLLGLGGLDAMKKTNQAKAEKLYAVIDQSDFYSNPVALQDRSWMNVPFNLGDKQLEKRFLEEAEKAELYNLKGHRAVGGMRASIYNAVPMEAVSALVEFMVDFEKRLG